MASEFAKYEQVTTWAGHRLLTMAESEQSFRQLTTTKRDTRYFHLNLVGIAVAIFIALGVIWAWFFAIYKWMDSTANIIFGTTIVALGTNTVAIILRKK